MHVEPFAQGLDAQGLTPDWQYVPVINNNNGFRVRFGVRRRHRGPKNSQIVTMFQLAAKRTATVESTKSILLITFANV